MPFQEAIPFISGALVQVGGLIGQRLAERSFKKDMPTAPPAQKYDEYQPAELLSRFNRDLDAIQVVSTSVAIAPALYWWLLGTSLSRETADLILGGVALAPFALSFAISSARPSTWRKWSLWGQRLSPLTVFALLVCTIGTVVNLL
jgi:hypothetical protein